MTVPASRTKRILLGVLAILLTTALYFLYESFYMSEQHKHTNRLIHATSPYLLQHAHNPVDWYEWSEEALQKAKQEDKPILVSIGYSSCHWCHVMERESFENEEIAAIMNEFFICIKVDREERPDVDQVYMEAVQAMGVNGGWPLNVFLTPDQNPFYGGTYFPPRDWTQLLTNIHKAFGLKRIELEASAQDVADALRRSDLDRFRTTTLDERERAEDLDSAFTRLEKGFDRVWGGMNKAPKFVMPTTWQWLLRYHHLTRNQAAYEQLVTTLKRVAMGGIHDHLAGGFARYSVDGYWFAPHFEKMLYDNAQLMSLYAEAYAVTHDPEMQQVCEGIYQWLTTEMTHPDGGFYSALDADSDGIEGQFYVWKKDELNRILGDDAPLFCEYFSVQDSGNWEHGNNILIRQKPDSAFLSENHLTQNEWRSRLVKMKTTAYKNRSLRNRPGLDDKVITAWNAMMITGLTDAYRYLGDDRYLVAARKALRFLEKNLMQGNQVYRSYKGKRNPTPGFLDDYAHLIDAYIRMYQMTFEENHLQRASDLMEHCLAHYFDANEKFFFYSGESDLIVRKKEVFDNVTPSSNSVMARNLNTLGLILDRQDWKTLAGDMALGLARLIQQEPNYMSNWAMALLEIQKEPAEIVIVGPEAHELRKELQTHFQPLAIVMGTEDKSSIPLLEGKTTVNGETTIYVCFNKTCKRPVTSVAEALVQMGPGKGN